MKFIILPLAPIIIGVCLVSMALLDEIAPIVGPIATVLWVLSFIVFGALIILGMLTETTWTNRIINTCFSLPSGFIGILSSRNFFEALMASSSNPDIGALLELIILVVLGGGIWLSVVGLCLGGCLIVHDDTDDLRYFKSIGFTTAAYVLTSFFNML